MMVTCLTYRYLPNLRYLARLCEVDYAVVLDLAPMPHQNKNSFVSRNRIQNKLGEYSWLSIPIHRKGVEFIKNASVEKTYPKWIEKHIKSIAYTYPNHKKIAGNFLSEIERVLLNSSDSLIDINSNSLNLILDFLNIDVQIIRESSILNNHTKQHRLDVSKQLNASCYIAGEVEWEYMLQSSEIDKMEQSGIHVVRTPELDQTTFPTVLVKELSCIHAIFTLGLKNTKMIIDDMVRCLRFPNG